MRVVMLGAGAANMLCGSCLRDNRLAATLRASGRDVLLIPLYTPMRSDEPDVTAPRVLYGGINAFLRQKTPRLHRLLPDRLTRLLDSPRLLRRVGRFAARTRPEDVAELTLDVLRGPRGRQAAALRELIESLRVLQPRLVVLPNLMFVGIARTLRSELGAAIACALTGEDLFLDGLPNRAGEEAHALIRESAADVDGFLAVSAYYRGRCIERFALPAERVHHTPLGISVSETDLRSEPPERPFRIGYLARIAPEKGLMKLVDALAVLRRAGRECAVRSAGWCGDENRAHLKEIMARARSAGVADAFSYSGEMDRAEKFRFLRELHVFCLPSVYPEAKGLPVLEALAAGVPVVLPRRGAFPELVEATGGGILYDPDDPHALPAAIMRLMDDAALRIELGRSGQAAVRARFTDQVMAERTWAAFERILEHHTATQR
ncbi:MAG: glycosyltransferase family 4 protein [Planctomycetes bacterium]|nr:glycosyltransferase family 4 protein [Planctomycetota bacterium]